jgi:nucleotide-binding universal stress UspA family protein
MTTEQLVKVATHSAPQLEPQPGAIVVGFDGSDASRCALAWAVREAHVLDAPLTICHVHAAGFIGKRPVSQDYGEQALRQAHLLATHRLGTNRVVAAARHGDPARALGELSQDARMLVVGTHGAYAHGGGPFAPYAARIVAKVHSPVVVVPQIAGSAMGAFRNHVVVAVDGSPPARAALEFGFAYADRHAVPLAAVHVTDESSGDYWTDDDFLETHFVTEPRAETLLATQVEPWHARYPRVHVKRAVYAGRVEPALLRAASGARLLVAGDRGRGLASTVLGSVAEHLIGSITCPMAVVKATDRS